MRDGRAWDRSEEFHSAGDAAKVGESTRFRADAETKEIFGNASQKESKAIRQVIDIELDRFQHSSVLDTLEYVK